MGSTLSKGINKNNQHTPDLAIFPKLQHSPPLIWKVKHVRQDLLNKQLRPPEGYIPSPFSSSSFHKLGNIQAYYRGEWKKGIPHGKGQIVFKDESYYKGYMNEGSAKGPECLFITKDGSYYLGNVSQGSKRSGKGIFVQRSGEEEQQGYKYEGQWLQNLPHGEGTEYFANGDTFNGRFVKGIRQGLGTYTWQKGPYLKYKGFFKNNVFEGKGILQKRDQAIIQGNFDCGDDFNIKNSTIIGKDFKITGKIYQIKIARQDKEVYRHLDISNNNIWLQVRKGKLSKLSLLRQNNRKRSNRLWQQLKKVTKYPQNTAKLLNVLNQQNSNKKKSSKFKMLMAKSNQKSSTTLCY